MITKKQAELYAKLRKKGFAVKMAESLAKDQPSLAKKLLKVRMRKK